MALGVRQNLFFDFTGFVTEEKAGENKKFVNLLIYYIEKNTIE